MRLSEDWQAIIKEAWSIRLGALAAMLSGAEVVVPLFSDSIPRGWFSVLSFVTVFAAMIARLIAQPKSSL